MEDIAGVRVICRFVEDIEKVIELIRNRRDFDMEIVRERDYITNTKPSGYQSYHIHIKYRVMSTNGVKEIWAEIQIRTLAMNFWATIEHSLKYKYNGNIPEDIQARLRKSATAAFQLDREMSKIRDEITEAQKIILVKNDLVDSITKKISNLYHVAKLEKVNELNREWIDLYQDCNLDQMNEFHEKLKTIAKMYKVEHV
jgi:putative GTP pyrophosphokinase